MSSRTPQDARRAGVVERALAAADAATVVVRRRGGARPTCAGPATRLTTNGVDARRGTSSIVLATVDGGSGAGVGGRRRSGRRDQTSRRWSRAAEAGRPGGRAGRGRRAAGRARPAGDADWDADAGETSIDVFAGFAAGARRGLRRARDGGECCSASPSTRVTTTYLGTSTGLRLRARPAHRAGRAQRQVRRLRAVGVGRRGHPRLHATSTWPPSTPSCAQRLGWAQRRIDLPAGRYETLLPPTAVADLMIYLYWSSAARDADEGRTVFAGRAAAPGSASGSPTLPLTLRSDPARPGLRVRAVRARATSSGRRRVGLRQRAAAIGASTGSRDGELATLIQTRHSRRADRLPVTAADRQPVLDAGGDARRSTRWSPRTERGLLLTCLWYIREVDPQTLLLTGLTRDGVYLVEGGEVVGEVNNFRFNESPVDLLGRLTEAGATERTLPREWRDYFTRAAMPALRVPDFNMSSVCQGR